MELLSYLLCRPVLAIVLALRVGDIHEEIVTLVKVLLHQPYAHRQDKSSVQLDTFHFSPALITNTLLVHPVRDRSWQRRRNGRKSAGEKCNREPHLERENEAWVSERWTQCEGYGS